MRQVLKVKADKQLLVLKVALNKIPQPTGKYLNPQAVAPLDPMDQAA